MFEKKFLLRAVLVAVISISALAGAVYLSARIYSSHQKAVQRRILVRARREAFANLDKEIRDEIKKFNGTAAFVIKDLDTGVEISFNRDVRMPSASMAKVPIMAVLFFAAAEGRIRLDETMSVKESYKAQGSGTLKWDKPGKEYTVERLMELMIAESDNTAANMIIERLGLDYLNGYFKRMGLKGTNLSRKMMDFKSRRNGIENYTTAGDMAILLEDIYYGRLQDAASSKKCLSVLARQKVNDRIPKRLPPGMVIAHKTGLERGVCHDAGIVYTKNGNFLISVLTRHGNKYAAPAKKLISDIAVAAYDCYK